MTDNRMFGGPAMVSVGVRWCSGQYNEGDVVILDKETALEIAVCAEVSNALFLVGRKLSPLNRITPCSCRYRRAEALSMVALDVSLLLEHVHCWSVESDGVYLVCHSAIAFC